MELSCREIIHNLEEYIKDRAKTLSKDGVKPRLVDIIFGSQDAHKKYIAIKKRTAEQLGISFKAIVIDRIPTFENLARILKELSNDPDNHAIIIQRPLPSQLQTDSLYKYISIEKEIEGHKPKSTFHAPLGLSILNIIKYMYRESEGLDGIIFDAPHDIPYLRKALKHKRIILLGRGSTAGQPIGKTFTDLKVNYLNINSTTFNSTQYFSEADIIICAVGKKVIKSQDLSPGVALINVGHHYEHGVLKGDYSITDVKEKASYYTPIVGGAGKIDVLYLLKNTVDAAWMQHHGKKTTSNNRTNSHR